MMDTEENKNLIKRESAFLQKIGNQISITSKLLAISNEKLAKEYVEIGLKHGKEKNYDEAILNFSNAIQLKPDYGEAYFRRASLLNNIRKDYQAAIEDYSRSIEFKVEEDIISRFKISFNFLSAIYGHRASAKLHLKDFKGAITDYNLALEYVPCFTPAISLKSRAVAKKCLGDLNGAIEDWMKSYTVNGKVGEIKDAEKLIEEYYNTYFSE